jgi:hypothetical protein
MDEGVVHPVHERLVYRLAVIIKYATDSAHAVVL